MTQDYDDTRKWYRLFEIVTRGKPLATCSKEGVELAAFVVLQASANPNALPDGDLPETHKLRDAWDWFERNRSDLIYCEVKP